MFRLVMVGLDTSKMFCSGLLSNVCLHIKTGKNLITLKTECFINTKDEVLREKFKKIGVCDFESPSRKIEPIKLDDELIGIVEVLLYEKVNELTESLNKFNEQLAKERKK